MLFPFLFGCTNIPIEGLKSLEFGYSDGRRIKAVYKIDSDNTGYTVTIQKEYSDENLPTFTATAQQIAELEQILNSFDGFAFPEATASVHGQRMVPPSPQYSTCASDQEPHFTVKEVQHWAHVHGIY